jgi:DNA gyrase subunit B
LTDETPEIPAVKNDDYDSSNIKHLKGIEGIRMRPAMYIGDTTARGLHHLVYEVADNSIDESVNGFASRVQVTLHSDGSVSVSDDGRGIPIGPMADMENRPALEVVLTEIHAGGKFDRDSGYKTGTGGLHGVGITAVNALSESLIAEVRREGHIWTMEFEKGKAVTELKKMGNSDTTGTKLTFRPDREIFPETRFNYEPLAKRLQELAFLTPGIIIGINDERSGDSDEYHYENGIVEFVKYLNRADTPIFSDVIHIADEQNGMQVSVALQYTDGFSDNIRAFANNISNLEGGTHLSGFRTALTRTINAYGKKEGIFKDSVPNGDDFREGLTAVVTVRIPDPQFEGQTKTKLGNSDVEGLVNSVVGEHLAKYFEENPSVAKTIANKGLRALEAREAAKKAREMVRRKGALTTGGLPEKLRDCRSRELDITELYMVEGDSAGGTADTGRDSNIQAILPLRGKILNVEKAQLVKVLDNAEISNIFKAMGIPPGAELEDISKRRYGKLIVMTDADVDGSHIRTLLLTFIFRHMRKLMEEGCVYIAQPPLYKVIQKKKVRYVQTHEQMNRELMELGLNETTLLCKNDETVFDSDNLNKLVDLMRRIEEPLSTMEKRGIELKFIAKNFSTEEGMLPQFRLNTGTGQHWFATRDSMTVFMEEEQERLGVTFKVADKLKNETLGDSTEEEKVTFIEEEELHEIKAINETLKNLKSFGFGLKDLIPVGIVNAEIVYPFVLQNEDGNQSLQSLRALLTTLRKMGERGLKVTRFKGLGEMDSDELWDTAMDPEKRILLQVTMEDSAAADEIFRVLMGDQVEPRRQFIEKHALDVNDLDV